MHRSEIVSPEGPPAVRPGTMPQPGYRLSAALELLQRVNCLRTDEGTPIHDVYLHEGFSLWSFTQNYLYETCLKKFTRFGPVLEWAGDHPGARTEEAVARYPELRGLFNPPKTEKGSPWDRLLLSSAAVLLQGLWQVDARLRKARILVYTPDIQPDKHYAGDFRFSKAYEYLSQGKKRYAEIFHTTGIRISLKNSWKRKRMPTFLEFWQYPGIPARPDGVGLDGLGAMASRLLRGHIEHYLNACRVSAVKVEGLRKAVRRSGVKVLLGMDDFRASNELLLACRLEGVKTILVQHGLITRFHVGWIHYGIPHGRLVSPDHFLVRAPFWKSVLDDAHSHLARAATVVSGMDGSAEPDFQGTASTGAVKDRIDVLLLLETLWDPCEARDYVKKLTSDLRLCVHFKVRPDIDEAAQMRDYFGELRPHAVVRDFGAAGGKDFDVVLGSHSSLMYKLLEWGKPVFRMATSFEFGEQLTRFGLAEELRLEDDFHARFAEAVSRHTASRQERWERFMGKEKYPDYRNVLSELIGDVA